MFLKTYFPLEIMSILSISKLFAKKPGSTKKITKDNKYK